MMIGKKNAVMHVRCCANRKRFSFAQRGCADSARNSTFYELKMQLERHERIKNTQISLEYIFRCGEKTPSVRCVVTVERQSYSQGSFYES